MIIKINKEEIEKEDVIEKFIGVWNSQPKKDRLGLTASCAVGIGDSVKLETFWSGRTIYFYNGDNNWEGKLNEYELDKLKPLLERLPFNFVINLVPDC